jgi:hypothetical protein
LVVKEVVCHVIQGVTKHTASVRSCCRIPVVEEDSVRKLPEGRRERGKQRRWHDESVFVHRKVVVDAVEEEMKGNADAVVGEVSGNVSLACNGTPFVLTRPSGTSTCGEHIR